MDLTARAREVKRALAAYYRAFSAYERASERDGTSPESDEARYATEQAANWLANAVRDLLGN